MLNTILFRSTYKKKLTGDVNFLALKMSKIETTSTDLESAFLWVTYGGISFWDNTYSRNTIDPEKWTD